MSGRSVAATPPGTAAATGSGVAADAGDGATTAAGEVAVAGGAGSTAATGEASGISSGARVAPPTVARSASDRSRSGDAIRSCGYRVNRCDTLVCRSSPSSALSVTPEPCATISRHPVRSANDRSTNVMSMARSVIVVGSGASNEQTSRIVERPPTPSGNDNPAAVRRGVRLEPPADSASELASPSQAVMRPASISSSDSDASPSVSKSKRAWNVGISAWSITRSSRIRSGSTRIPA